MNVSSSKDCIIFMHSLLLLFIDRRLLLSFFLSSAISFIRLYHNVIYYCAEFSDFHCNGLFAFAVCLFTQLTCISIATSLNAWNWHDLTFAHYRHQLFSRSFSHDFDSLFFLSSVDEFFMALFMFLFSSWMWWMRKSFLYRSKRGKFIMFSFHSSLAESFSISSAQV